MKLNKPILGANNVASINELPENSLRDCVNLDITNRGTLKTRDELVQVYTGINCHSLFEDYFVENGDLKLLNQDNTATLVPGGTGIGANKLSYLSLNGIIYFSSKSNHGRIINGEVKSFSIPSPSLPLLTIGNGDLLAGSYLVDITYIDSLTHEESGSAGTQVIKVLEGSRINIDFGNIPNGLTVQVYCSKQNGETLYYHSSNSNEIVTVKRLSTPLETQFLSEMPLGEKLIEHKGRTFVVDGKYLYHSESGRFGLTRASSGWLQFNSDIKIIANVEDGLYVVADKTYFLSGVDPKDFKQVIVDNATALDGEAVYVPSSDLGFDEMQDLKLPVWMNEEGYVVGLPSGKIQQVTKNRLAISDEANFVMQQVESNGIRQLVSSVSGALGSNFGASDRAVVTIIRNGVVI